MRSHSFNQRARWSLCALLLVACSPRDLPPRDSGPSDALDASTDASVDARLDSGVDTGVDTGANTGADTGADVGRAIDSGPDVEEDAGPETGRTLTFALDRLTIERSGSTAYAGFNLDGIFSNPDGTTPRSCMRGDYSSTLDLDQNHPIAALDPMTGRPSGGPSMCAPGAGCRGGVDNQLPEIADLVQSSSGMDVRANAQRFLDTGELAFIVRISGVDDLMNDPSVTLRVYQAYPTFSTGCTSVTPDREYAIAQSSLVDGATSIDQARYRVRGAIVNGRLIPNGGASLPLPVAPGLTVDVLGAMLRANVTEAALTAGNLGGYARGTQFYEAIVAMMPSIAPLAATLVGQLVDLEEPIPTPGSAPGLCARATLQPPQFGNIGIGATFSAVRATVAPSPAAAREPGTCGSM
jgi:hypothetical protein